MTGSSRVSVFSPPALADGRFAVDVTWQAFDGSTGIGRLAEEPTDQSVLYWFFGPENWELMVKVLDACSVNGHYWVFTAGSTTVAYQVLITDQQTGTVWRFDNPLGERSRASADVLAFTCG